MRWSTIPFLLIASAGFSQVYIGNRGGVSIGKQYFAVGSAPLGTQAEKYRSQPLGGNAAVTIEWPLTDHLGLQTDFGYTEKGFLIPAGSPAQSARRLFRLGYADLSVMAKWSALSGGLRPEFFIGPMVARTLRLRDESGSPFVLAEDDGYTTFFNGENRAEDHLAPWEFSAVAGAGFIIQPGVARIHMNYRYVYGLTNIFEDGMVYADVNGSVIRSADQANRTHLVTVGWSIPLSREAWDETPSGR